MPGAARLVGGGGEHAHAEEVLELERSGRGSQSKEASRPRLGGKRECPLNRSALECHTRVMIEVSTLWTLVAT